MIISLDNADYEGTYFLILYFVKPYDIMLSTICCKRVLRQLEFVGHENSILEQLST